MQKNKNLTELDLYYNNLDTVGLMHLGKSLKSNDQLKSLNLGFNKLESDSIKSFFESFNFSNLTYLYLGGNQIKESGVNSFIYWLCSVPKKLTLFKFERQKIWEIFWSKDFPWPHLIWETTRLVKKKTTWSTFSNEISIKFHDPNLIRSWWFETFVWWAF